MQQTLAPKQDFAFSVVIITFNEAANIGRCLASLQGLTDDVWVADSQSTDDTVPIAQALGANTAQVEWKGFSATKNEVARFAKYNWILSLDADEELSEELRQSLSQLQPQQGELYQLDRLTSYCGKWIRHSGWYPDWLPRLFHRHEAEWQGDFVHERLVAKVPLREIRLQGKLLHYSYTSADDHLRRIDRYTTLAAQQLHAKGKRVGVLKTVFGPAFRFLRTYFIKLGFLDGREGFIIANRNASMVRMRYRKLKALYQNQQA